MKNITLLPTDRDTLNPVLVRLNCLALACLEEKYDSKIYLAKKYEQWVFSGVENPIMAKVVISDSAYENLKKSGVIDQTQVKMPEQSQ